MLNGFEHSAYHSLDMPHHAEFDQIERLPIRVMHTLITERSAARAASATLRRHAGRAA